MIKRLLAIVVLLALFAASCGGDDSTETGDSASATNQDEDGSTDDQPVDTETDDEPVDDDPEDDPEEFSGDKNSDFCQTAREFEENDPFETSSPLAGASFFEEAEALYNDVIPDAPSEIRGDLEIMRDGVLEMGAVFEKYDYNFLAEGLDAEMEALDTTAMDEAGERFSTYLVDVCGIEDALEPDPDDVGGLLPEGIDPEDLEDIDIDSDAAQAIMDQFGIDEELAACLNDELGADFDFDDAASDASFLTQEICGTTILEIISGLGQG